MDSLEIYFWMTIFAKFRAERLAIFGMMGTIHYWIHDFFVAGITDLKGKDTFSIFAINEVRI